MATSIGPIGEIDTAAAVRASLVLTPLVLVAVQSENSDWLLAAIVSISAYIAMDRSGLAPFGVVLHGLAITAGFMVLLAAFATPPLFVLGCATMAAASVLLSGRGSKLQSLGIFTFVPALYLACEVAEGAAPHELARHGLAFLPFLAVALIPVLLMSAFDHARARDAEVSHINHFGRLLRWSELGVRSFYGEAAIAAALSVAVAAAVVEWRHLDHGQWVIWSAACVVTGDAASGQRKLLDRSTGAIVGVPLGAAVGLLIPKDLLSYSSVAIGIASILAVLSLVALRRYVVAFGLRCGCAAFILVLASQSATIATERAANVIIGGVIGISFVLITRTIFGAIKSRTDHKNIETLV
jgi:Fusaric acid resistance protein-like